MSSSAVTRVHCGFGGYRQYRPLWLPQQLPSHLTLPKLAIAAFKATIPGKRFRLPVTGSPWVYHYLVYNAEPTGKRPLTGTLISGGFAPHDDAPLWFCSWMPQSTDLLNAAWLKLLSRLLSFIDWACPPTLSNPPYSQENVNPQGAAESNNHTTL